VDAAFVSFRWRSAALFTLIWARRRGSGAEACDDAALLARCR